MSTLMQPATAFQPPSLPVRRFTVDEYHRLIQIGMLTEDDPVELLEGLIVPKMPRNPPHDGTIQISSAVLRQFLPPDWEVRVQCAITLLDSEPEPDLAVVPGPPARFLQLHPGPLDIALLMEIADSSLLRDRLEKGRLYARAGIAIYWIVNLSDRWIEVYTDPSGPGANPTYHQRQDFPLGTQVPLVLGGQQTALIPVSSILP
jgi:hypothetical protein